MMRRTITVAAMPEAPASEVEVTVAKVTSEAGSKVTRNLGQKGTTGGTLSRPEAAAAVANILEGKVRAEDVASASKGSRRPREFPSRFGQDGCSL